MKLGKNKQIVYIYLVFTYPPLMNVYSSTYLSLIHNKTGYKATGFLFENTESHYVLWEMDKRTIYLKKDWSPIPKI